MSLSKLVENTGSAARDWCMLERNILSHVKLCLLLSLLSASILLHARLSGPSDKPSDRRSHRSLSDAGFPLAFVLMASALITIVAGSWEYWSSDRDMRSRRAFMIANKPHVAMLTVVSCTVFSICIILLADEGIA